MSLLRLPESFALSRRLAKLRMATVIWDAEGIVLIDYIEHGSTSTGIYILYAGLIRKARAALKEKRRGKLHHVVL